MGRDKQLLREDANERSITHKLAGHLEKHFPHYDVDCEYNRNCGDVKRLQSFPELESFPEEAKTDDTNATTVFPDIIVHQRGKPEGQGNLLVIEAKKSTNQIKEMERDRKKLEIYKRDPHLKYEHAVFLVLRTGDDPGVKTLEFVK